MTYKVLLRVKGFSEFEVEANSIRQARAKIESRVESGNLMLDAAMRDCQILMCERKDNEDE